MEPTDLKDLREGLGFCSENGQIVLNKNKFGGYNKKEVEEALSRLNQNCISLQKAWDEKNMAFNEAVAKAKRENAELEKKAEKLAEDLAEREAELAECKEENRRLSLTLAELLDRQEEAQAREERVKEEGSSRADETLLKENLCFKEQIEEANKELERFRTRLFQQEETIMKKEEEIESLKSKAQADLNLAYKSFSFRLQKIKSMAAGFQDLTTEIEHTIQNKIEGIARQTD